MIAANPPGLGPFTAGPDKLIYFAPGNLQYKASTDTWRFAPNQYDVIGPKTPFWGSERAYKNDHFDLFGWATSGFWSSPSLTSLEDYQYGKGCGDLNGTKNDWGAYNAISNGGKKANLWRTLTGDEWEYLLKRNEGKLRSFADVNGVRGMILLPDDWTPIPDLPIRDTSVFHLNMFTESQWAQLEAQGAVFLPCADVTNYYLDEMITQTDDWVCGAYWTSSANPDYNYMAKAVVLMIFAYGSGDANLSFNYDLEYNVWASVSNARRHSGFSVRLVRDVKK